MYKAESDYGFCNMPIEFQDSFFEHKDIIVHADNMSVIKCDSTLSEFGIKQSYKQALMEYYASNPLLNISI
jgi:hypothetical protein